METPHIEKYSMKRGNTKQGDSWPTNEELQTTDISGGLEHHKPGRNKDYLMGYQIHLTNCFFDLLGCGEQF